MRYGKRTGIVAALVLGASLVLAGCASAPDEPASGSGREVYTGAGTGESLGEAINAAKMDAVRKAVVDLIGAQAEAAQADRLDEVLYSTRTPNAYVYNETMETIRRDGSLIDGDLRYEIRIRVNVDAVRTTLEVNGIGRGAGAASGGAGEADGTDGAAGGEAETADDGQAQQRESDTGVPLPDYANVTDGERRFIAGYVDRMTYMVFFPDRAVENVAGTVKDPGFLLRSAVNQANGYLVNNGHLVVDASQVEQLREDQRLVYEEQVGQELSLLQWVARRLDADVYIELDARVSGRSAGSGHYATADVTLTMYETSTAQILGSVNRRSQESFSRTSTDDAAVNALQSTVYQAMPQAVEMSERQMAQTLTRGLRYELTLQKPPDARTLSRFRREMSDEVREIATVSQSPDDVAYEVFFIGSTDDLIDLVFVVTDRLAGFEDMTLVLSRGRSVTFDVGF